MRATARGGAQRAGPTGPRDTSRPDGTGITDRLRPGRPLAVGAVDLLSGDLVYFDRGPVAEAVRASSAIPTVLPPVPLDDRLFLDGGVIDNFGVNEAVRRGARSIVLVDASTSEGFATR